MRNPSLFEAVDPERVATGYYTEISLRDLFAGVVLAGIEACPTNDALNLGDEDRLKRAFMLADKMLVEREK